MNFLAFIKNPIVLVIGERLLDVLVSLVKSFAIPKVKRMAFERMTESMQVFGEFILDQKEKVEATETEADDEAYKLGKEAFRKFLDEGEILYNQM